MQILLSILAIVLSALLWRARGSGVGAKATVAFACVQAITVAPAIGLWSLVFAVWISLGELSGWKPKEIKDHRSWLKAAVFGFLIGGFGAITVPASTWLAEHLPEPQLKMFKSRRLYSGWYVSEPSELMNWNGAWNEVYNGALYSIFVQVATIYVVFFAHGNI